MRVSGLYGFIALLHGLGWGLYLHYSRSYPALVGLGFAAYMFGLRHAFDADHIAAVDDTVRFMLQKGKRPRPALMTMRTWSSCCSSVVCSTACLADGCRR